MATNITANNMAFDAPGDATSNVDGVPYGDEWSSLHGNSYYLSGIEVSTNDPSKGTVGVLADGWYSYGDPYPQIWPTWVDYLSQQLGSSLPGGITMDGYGEADAPVQTRHRNVLAEPNLRTVIVDMSTIRTGDTLTSVRQRLTNLINASSVGGLKRYHRSDGTPIQVVLATIAPQGWAVNDARELVRRQLNGDIRQSYPNYGADAVVDFDAAVRDPSAPNRMAADYATFSTSGYQNPTDACEQRLAQVIIDGVNGWPPLEL